MNETRQTVLVVDDTPVNIDLLSDILRKDYQVKAAVNGAKALEIARAEPAPDIILLDIMMPEMSGHEVCRQLKEDPNTADIPIIFVTAKSEVEDEKQGLDMGAVDYITKPFNPEIVEARVRNQLSLHQQRDQLRVELFEALKGRVQSGFVEHIGQHLAEIVAAGESHRLEFKSTLRWNLHTDKADKKIENQCLKTVAAYLNTEGGLLLIGVSDEGLPLGLETDRFASEDKLLLHWHNLLKECLGAQFSDRVRSDILELEGDAVLAVQCLSAGKPVFFRRDNEEAFFVRVGNSTQALKPSEILAYTERRFTSDKRDGGRA